MVEIKLNGEEKSFDIELSLTELVESLGLDPSAIVIQLNEEIVGRDSFGMHKIGHGDRIELLKFMAGG